MQIKAFWYAHWRTIAAVSLLVGHFAPWVQHRSAALTLSAHELATVTNFTPYAGIFVNEGYLLPLWGAALLLAAAGRRWVLVGAVCIAALGLPGYPELRALLSGSGSPFAAQLALTIVCWVGCVALTVAARQLQHRRYSATLAALIAMFGAAPVAGFIAIKSVAIERLYGAPVSTGWGWWLTLCASLALCQIAFVTILASRSRAPCRIAPG
jgi:hypothetical protein